MASTRNSAGINSSSGKNVNPFFRAAKAATSYVGNVGREIRDIPTAIGAPKRMQVGTGTKTSINGDTGKKETYTMPKYASNARSGIKAQLKEAIAAVTSGQKGSSVGHVSAVGTAKPRKTR